MPSIVIKRDGESRQSVFTLDDSFIAQFVGQQPEWGPVGYVTYKRTYARDLTTIHERHRELGRAAGLASTEEFWLTLVRVVEGTFTILANHCASLRLPWNWDIAQKKAQEMYRLMWDFKFLPPGRGLWMMGTPALDKVGGAAANNCGFQSTANIDVDFAGPFCALMDFSMLGVGVGGDTRGAGKVTIQESALSDAVCVVEDSREGWVEILRIVLEAYVGIGEIPRFDYSQVRRAGSPIKGFGGTASGPGPLREMVESIRALLDARAGQTITSADIVDIFNLVGRCVVAGNVRRSAEIMFGEPTDDGFLELKDREKHAAAVDSHRWASNNSVFATVGQHYTRQARLTAKNGEPGYFWLDNARAYGRMSDAPDHRDAKVMGGNPCVTADTAVLTVNGPVRVDALLDQPFLAVVGESTYLSRTGFFQTGTKAVVRLTTQEGHALRLTPDHKVLVADDSYDNRLWVPAGELKPGVKVVLGNLNDLATVQSVEPDGEEPVYDCTVDDIHAFSANGITVHNCLEQSLFDGELCNLVETFPFHHASAKEYKRTVKFAYLYAKAVTLVPTHNPKTNAVTLKNRRIGCSMSGIVQAIKKFGRRKFFQMCDETYRYIQELDKEYSDWLCVPRSIKTTSVKPSGTVSLLPRSVTPGMHHPIAEYYWRVIRFATDSPMLPALRAAGHQCIEIDPAKEPNTTAVYFPVRIEDFDRSERDISMWEQLELAADLQAYWADNQVSVTVKFDPKSEGPQIARALEIFETRLKGVSFLPHDDHGYEHAPYQSITKDEYEAAIAGLKPLDLAVSQNETQERFCDSDKCEWRPAPST